MAGKYFVHIPKDSSVYGPYSLVKAKQFARIGSQYGLERVVTRGPAGRRVRVYADGARRYPVTTAQLRGLSRGEVPKTLAVRSQGRRNPRGGLVQVLVYAGPGRNRLTLTLKGDDPTDPDVWAEVSRDALPLNQRERVTLARGGAVWGIVNGEWFDTMVEETLERRGFGRAEWGVSNGALLEDAYFEQVIGMSEQEFAESPPPGFSYRADARWSARRQEAGHTALSHHFFRLAPDARRATLYHEIGHDLMRDFNNDWKGVLEPFRQDRELRVEPTGRSEYDNPYGMETRPEELVADVYAAMFTGGERWFEGEKYKALFRRARAVAGRLGLPLPENV